MKKDMPWQDILPLSKWISFLHAYKKMEITSNATTFADRFHRRRRIDDDLLLLSSRIRGYHGIPKRSIINLAPRANSLRLIAHTGQSFLNRFRIGEKGSATGAQKGSLDYAVTKLVRRATRKAEYLEQLKVHVESDPRSRSKRSLIEYLQREKSRPDDMVGLIRDVRLEKLDPWHRPFESPIMMPGEFRYEMDHSHMFNAVFSLWQRDNTTDVPLFVWMEGHYVCTGVFNEDLWGQQTQEWVDDGMGMPKGSGQVSYGANEEICITHIIGNRLHTALIGASEYTPLNTLQSAGKGDDTVGMHAYVWDKHGDIYTANHAGGSLHHSSFTSGSKVKCAGMIRVNNGKVRTVTNDSGHYQPGKRYLLNFVRYLMPLDVFEKGPNGRITTMVGYAPGVAHVLVDDFLTAPPPPPRAPTIPSRVGRPPVPGRQR